MPLEQSRFSPPPSSHGPFVPHEPPPPIYSPPGFAPGFYPITVGRAVSLSWSLYRYAWRTFVAIGLISSVPAAVILAAASAYDFGPMNDWNQSVTIGHISPSQMLATYPWASLASTLLSTLAVGPIVILGGGAILAAFATAFTGGRPGVRAAYSAAFARVRDLVLVFVVVTGATLGLSAFASLFPLLGALGPGGLGLSGVTLFASLIVVVALVFAVAFVTIRLTLTTQVVMLEHMSAGAALRRSWGLAAGSMWRIVGWLIVFSLLVGLVALLFEVVGVIAAFIISPPRLSAVTSFFTPASIFVFTFVITALGGILTPIVAIGTALLYFDIRHRRGEQVPVPGQQPPA